MSQKEITMKKLQRYHTKINNIVKRDILSSQDMFIKHQIQSKVRSVNYLWYPIPQAWKIDMANHPFMNRLKYKQINLYYTCFQLKIITALLFFLSFYSTKVH